MQLLASITPTAMATLLPRRAGERTWCSAGSRSSPRQKRAPARFYSNRIASPRGRRCAPCASAGDGVNATGVRGACVERGVAFVQRSVRSRLLGSHTGKGGPHLCRVASPCGGQADTSRLTAREDSGHHASSRSWRRAAHARPRSAVRPPEPGLAARHKWGPSGRCDYETRRVSSSRLRSLRSELRRGTPKPLRRRPGCGAALRNECSLSLPSPLTVMANGEGYLKQLVQ